MQRMKYKAASAMLVRKGCYCTFCGSG
jgi:hypothetical protein